MSDTPTTPDPEPEPEPEAPPPPDEADLAELTWAERRRAQSYGS